jgi:hypothetical protein
MTPAQRHAQLRRRPPRAALAALVLVAIGVALLLPPSPATAPRASWETPATIRGAYHIHSNRSDGAGTLDDIALAASRAGLQFVIVTDHGDGTRPPEPATYRHGVLCIDAVELSTNEGHYVALGMPAAAYPLAGTAESVVEDVTRLGGFGLVAHPDSARPSLRWEAWDLPFHGFEWLNADSEWRDEPLSALARAVITYWIRPSPSLVSILDRPQAAVTQWDGLISRRRVPALAATDAHGRLGWRQDSDPGAGGWHLPMPSYQSSFSAFSNHVILDRPLTGEAAVDGASLLAAVREGRTFTVIEGLAGPGGFEFTGASGHHTARIGEDLVLESTTTLHARVAAPPGASMRLMNSGAVVNETNGAELSFDVSAPGAYRVEVLLPGSALPWILSNPIYVGFDRLPAPAVAPPPAASLLPIAAAEANAEVSDGSTTDLEKGGELIWQYRVAPGTPAGQYAAVRLPVSGVSDATRLRFDASADRPMRLWAQLRRPVGTAGQRWGRTFYIDQNDRSIDLQLDTFRPVGITTTPNPALAQVDSLLFVVDTVNALPGASGRIRLSNIAFSR